MYEKMPERLRWVRGDSSESEYVKAGEIRNHSEDARVRLGFSAHAAAYWFPDLYPPEAMRD